MREVLLSFILFDTTMVRVSPYNFECNSRVSRSLSTIDCNASATKNLQTHRPDDGLGSVHEPDVSTSISDLADYLLSCQALYQDDESLTTLSASAFLWFLKLDQFEISSVCWRNVARSAMNSEQGASDGAHQLK